MIAIATKVKAAAAITVVLVTIEAVEIKVLGTEIAVAAVTMAMLVVIVTIEVVTKVELPIGVAVTKVAVANVITVAEAKIIAVGTKVPVEIMVLAESITGLASVIGTAIVTKSIADAARVPLAATELLSRRPSAVARPAEIEEAAVRIEVVTAAVTMVVAAIMVLERSEGQAPEVAMMIFRVSEGMQVATHHTAVVVRMMAEGLITVPATPIMGGAARNMEAGTPKVLAMTRPIAAVIVVQPTVATIALAVIVTTHMLKMHTWTATSLRPRLPAYDPVKHQVSKQIKRPDLLAEIVAMLVAAAALDIATAARIILVKTKVTVAGTKATEVATRVTEAEIEALGLAMQGMAAETRDMVVVIVEVATRRKALQ